MKIGIETTATKINRAGTGVYVSNLISSLQKIDTWNTYKHFFVNHRRDTEKTKTILSRFETLYRDILWTHILFPRQVYRSGVDILHMPANVIPLFLPCPTVVTILDTTILQTPHNFTFWHRNYSKVFIPLSVRRSSLILTISEHSKNDIVRQFAIPHDKVVVTYLAASERFQPVANSEVSATKQLYDLDKYILTVGTLEPRKNIIRLLQAFKKLRERGFAGKLIHVGPKGWLFDDILAEIERLELRESVRFLGLVPLDDLVRLYNAALMFVYPSLYEGFGLPPLEAMACGCPVVTSNTSSFPEVVGLAALMVDPYDVSQIADAMLRVIEDRVFATSMREQGLERARLFSWRRCAQETVAAYEQCMRRS
jgi:glycosyltransferase involved in cell wall biosynthesis